MKTAEQILREVYGITTTPDEDLQLYITLNPAQDKIEWAMREYLLHYLDKIIDKKTRCQGMSVISLSDINEIRGTIK